MNSSLMSGVRAGATWSIVLSLLMIVTGFVAIAAPMVAGVAITAIVGWLLVLSGAMHLLFGWRGGRPAAIVWEILLGIVYALIGVYLLGHPMAGLASLTLAIAVFLSMEGVLELILSFRLRPGRGSSWLLLDGIITLVLAVMIWSTWPSSAVWVIGTLIGVSMLFSGFTRLMLSIEVRRITAAHAHTA